MTKTAWKLQKNSSAPLNCQADWIQSQQSPNLRTFLVVLQIETTHSSKHTRLIPIQLCFMLHLHWPSLTAVNQTTSYTTSFSTMIHNACVTFNR